MRNRDSIDAHEPETEESRPVCSTSSNSKESDERKERKSRPSNQARPPPAMTSHQMYLNEYGGRTGLANIGNTCFLNASLQALMHCPPLVGMMLSMDLFRYRQRALGAPPLLQRKYLLVEQFVLVLRRIWGGSQRVCAPKGLVQRNMDLHTEFQNFGQHDSQEFTRGLLGCMHEAVRFFATYDYTKPLNGDAEGKNKGKNESRKKPRIREFSVISDLFEGTLRSDVKCSRCETVSTVCESFLDLSLEIPKDPDLKKVEQERGEQAMTTVKQGMLSTFTNYLGLTSPPLSLETLLHTFCTSSELSHPNQYLCEVCNDKVDAHKVLSISRLPEILCVHIKRFSYHVYGSKVSRNVMFKLKELDMAPYLHPTLRGKQVLSKYDLYGVVRHSGGLSGGHYVAYAKSHNTGKWFSFDDHIVTPVTAETVASQQAYILMYVRKSDPALTRRISRASSGGDTTPVKGPQSTEQERRPRYLISRYWRHKSQYMSDPGPIDNRGLCCRHGIPMQGISEGRLAFSVSEGGWWNLHARYGGGPAVPVDARTLCRKCEDIQRRRAEKQRIVSLEKQSARSGGDAWYLVSERWMREWREYILGMDDTPGPGPISNSDLFEENSNTLREGLHPARHYRGIRGPVWFALIEIYGGGPEVIRKRLHIYDPPYTPRGREISVHMEEEEEEEIESQETAGLNGVNRVREKHQPVANESANKVNEQQAK
ncbi:hypothetical protein AAMO2058_000991400 [Amorphochlora amoebiformis]